MASDVRRLHPLSPFYNLIRYVSRNALAVATAGFSGGRLLGTLMAIPMLLGSVIGFVAWMRFTYVIHDGELRIDEGVFKRRSRVVPVSRVQQVEIIQTLRHRLFGVAALRVDTGAEGAAAEVRLSVVSLHEASRLRAELLGDAVQAEGRADKNDGTLVRLGTGRLALAGITGPQLPLMLAILAWAQSWLDNLVRYWDDLPLDSLAHGEAVSVAMAAVALILLWLGLAAGAAIVADTGFTLRRDGDSIRVHRGLFDRRESSLSIQRVQALRVEQTILRRVFRLSSLRVQSAGGSKGRRGVSRITIPILSTGDLDGVVPALLPDLGSLPMLVPAPPAARRRAVVRRVTPVLLACVVIAAFSLPLAAVALLAVPLAIVAADLAYRGLSHGVSTTLLVARTGGLWRSTVIVPIAKAQSVTLSSSPMQRRLELATLAIHVAGRGPTPKIVDADVHRLSELVGKLSSAAAADEAALRLRLPFVNAQAEIPA